MVQSEVFTFRSSNGVNDIHCHMWIPEGTILGVIQLVHGVAEYIERYEAFVAFMAEQGFLVAGDDHLGHGQSIRDDSELGWFGEENGWSYLVQDEKKLLDILREKYDGVPFVLFGHSMGSFIARTYLGWYPGDYDCCILSGTGYHAPLVCKAGKMLAQREIKAHGSKYRSKRLQNVAFGGYLKGIENPIGENDWICRDKEVVRRYDADPKCSFTPTAGLMRDMMTGLDIICRSSHMVKMDKEMPVLFIAGDADPVGNYGKGVQKTAERFRQAGMADVSVNLYPGARHEVLNELNKEEVWDDVLGWLEDVLALP
ncbi:MAG: alpha/beta hydrolase [Oscillospiraceae bacterium]|nr:alpha/beta hydrolase [Oscillospiraceae bacterium]